MQAHTHSDNDAAACLPSFMICTRHWLCTAQQEQNHVTRAYEIKRTFTKLTFNPHLLHRIMLVLQTKGNPEELICDEQGKQRKENRLWGPPLWRHLTDTDRTTHKNWLICSCFFIFAKPEYCRIQRSVNLSLVDQGCHVFLTDRTFHILYISTYVGQRR